MAFDNRSSPVILGGGQIREFCPRLDGYDWPGALTPIAGMIAGIWGSLAGAGIKPMAHDKTISDSTAPDNSSGRGREVQPLEFRRVKGG
jgi:hypothetical protein